MSRPVLRTSVLRRLLAAGAALAAVGLMTACGSDDDSQAHDGHQHSHGASTTAASVAPGVNSADVSFAQMMIPHHQQAVEMAELVPSRTQNPWLLTFAEQVKNAQQPEIDQLTDALKSWGQEVPAGGGHHHMDGMMTAEQMANLEKLSGQAFDREWITMMIEHHEGAVDMAKTELADGENAEMRELAQSIVSAQQGEIDEMKAQLGS
ncbi:DUF305 domain-containing protein [Gordonia sp. VNK21]|uniref:DUF305 domain-containing protein n=1 Tax=Gordonia sp. VNK21 TaxID=3382483 RepID=UPI0038D4BFC1